MSYSMFSLMSNTKVSICVFLVVVFEKQHEKLMHTTYFLYMWKWKPISIICYKYFLMGIPAIFEMLDHNKIKFILPYAI